MYRVALAALACVLVMQGAQIWQGKATRGEMRALSQSLSRLAGRLEQVEEPIKSHQMSTTYLANHNGTIEPHTVTSTFQDSAHPNETWPQFQQRHFADVVAAQAGEWPPARP